MTANGIPTAPPANAAEAERRFFARYGTSAGSTWAAVQGYLDTAAPKPTTIEGWIAVAEKVRDQLALEQHDQQYSAPSPPPQVAARASLERIAVALERIADSLARLQTVPATPKASGDMPRGADGIPICPKHQRRMKESQYGGYFCTAPDPDTKNGKCILKVKE